MDVSVERLRRWLLTGAALLVVIIGGFLLYARYRVHRYLNDLPKKLGADIRQETNAFTWSQSVKGRTVFTLHASKAIQHKDGKYTLHDVGIAVYGHGEERGDRVDRIYGKEFDLDQTEGVVRAMGEVHLDLEAPAATDAKSKMDYAAGVDIRDPGPDNKDGLHEAGKGDARLIHVKTSGLVYLQKLGIAATEKEIEFEYNGLTGHATGAEYNADTGVLVLQSAVKVSGLQSSRPVLLTASRAELDRSNHTIVLANAKYVTVGDDRRPEEPRQTAEAHLARLYLRNDGSAEKLEGQNGVVLTSGDSSRMTAERGEVSFTPGNKPGAMHMIGRVIYTDQDASHSINTRASEAHTVFNQNGLAEKVTMTGSVHLNEHVNPAANHPSTSERDLTAASLELGLAATGKRSSLRTATATGNARLKVVDSDSKKDQQTSIMSGDILTAQFRDADGHSEIKELHLNGNTLLEQYRANGVVDKSSSDSLVVHFQNLPGGAASDASFGGRSQIASAVQQGHLVITRSTPPKARTSAQPEEDKTTALKATYNGAQQKTFLEGGVEMTNGTGTIWAEHLTLDQSGDATAEGSVKAGYRQGESSELTHIQAQRAEFKKTEDTAIFYGGATPARLWQGGSQIEAPVLEFAQRQGRLIARGQADTNNASPVHTVLAGSPRKTPPASADTSGHAAVNHPSVVRIASRQMIYSDQRREAEFTGGVRVESSDGVMRGQSAIAFLEAAKSETSNKEAIGVSSGLVGGSVKKVIVSGRIQIDQPGRRATGERLIYTADDGLFVLSGTNAIPSVVTDQVRGTITGVELRFHAQDESIVISRGDGNGAAPKVRTETRVKKER